MPHSVLLLLLLVLMAIAYRVGYRRALSVAGGIGRVKTLHTLPGYYGFYAALWAGLPALMLLGFWVGLQGSILSGLINADLGNPPDLAAGLSQGRPGLLLNDIKNLATGNIVSGDVTPELQAAADRYARFQRVPDGGPIAQEVRAALVIRGRVNEYDCRRDRGQCRPHHPGRPGPGAGARGDRRGVPRRECPDGVP
jgi:hypothetical protein